MLLPSDIIESLKLKQTESIEYKIPEVFPKSCANFLVPESTEEMNKILSFYNLPTFNGDVDSIVEVAAAYQKEVSEDIPHSRCPEKRNTNAETTENISSTVYTNLLLGMPEDVLENQSNNLCLDIPHLTALANKIKKYEQMEQYCDSKEIEMASRNRNDTSKLYDLTVDELRERLEMLQKKHRYEIIYERHSDIIDKLRTICKHSSDSGAKNLGEIDCLSVIDSLAFLKKKTEKQYRKIKMMEHLQTIVDDSSKDNFTEDAIKAKILLNIISGKQVEIEDVCESMNLTRPSVLVIIYNLQMMKVVKYDRATDLVMLDI